MYTKKTWLLRVYSTFKHSLSTIKINYSGQNENMYFYRYTLSVRITRNTLHIINVHIKSIWRLLIMISGVCITV